MKSVLLLFSLVIYVYSQTNFIPVPPATCPFFNDGNNDFYFAASNMTTFSCQGRSLNSCCKDSYLNKVANGTDFINSTISAVLSNLSGDCQKYVEMLSCAPCESDSATFVKPMANLYLFTLCNSFCDDMYSACSSATVTARSPQTVSEVYARAIGFCTSLFIQSDNVISTLRSEQDHTCYYPGYRMCDADDIVYWYSDCYQSERSLQFAWKSDANCTGGVELPQPQSHLPCPITCEAGDYLPLGQTTCKECPSGTFSLGGGFRVLDWDEWPTRVLQFNTYCVEYNNGLVISNCTGWSLNGSFIDSNIAGQHGTRSVLETNVNLNHNGSVAFNVSVEGEVIYDVLTFEVDGNIIQTYPNSVGKVLQYRVPLAQGYHVLRWLYSKDRDTNYGADHAAIYMIEVLALSEHSDFCTTCVAGTFSGAGATDCTLCPFGTHSSEDGSAFCAPCADDEYAIRGAVNCSKRLDCTRNDMQALYTECNENGERTLTYKWIEPRICKIVDVTLPERQEGLPCAPCNPGQYRSGSICVFCPEGQWSQGDQEACQPCLAGSYAPKQAYLNTWDSWPLGTVTECEDDCGPENWRLRGTYIDSGEGHGIRAEVSLTMPFEIDSEQGSVMYEYSLSNCGACGLQLYDNSTWLASSSLILGGQNITLGPFPLSRGVHYLKWLFQKYNAASRPDEDAKAIINQIIVRGVKEGGAGTCDVCPAGTYNDSPAASCRNCSIGQYSRPNSTQCLDCPANTYQDHPGQGQCKPCGHGTSTPSGSAECNAPCTYTPDGTTTVYDLSYLSRPDNLWGPIVQTHAYYVNPCTKTVENSSCVDSDGRVLFTYACQIDPYHHVEDLGQVMGYYPYDDPQTRGVIVAFTEGSPCTAPLARGTTRALNLTMICDPSAGRGLPEAPDNAEPTPCVYNLIWKSIYGCPICTNDDYEAVREVCVDGFQVIRYQWKDNPKKCHDGVQLPLNDRLNCSTSTMCPPGTHLTTDESCAPCEGNTFSLGSGETFMRFTENLDPFSTSCEIPDCKGWEGKGSYVQGGTGTSTLELVKNFQLGLPSLIEFSYHVMSHGEIFQFYIDSQVQLAENSLSPGYELFSSGLDIGSHRLRWVWETNPNITGVAPSVDSFVRIKNIRVHGTVPAVPSCTDCPPGTVVDSNKESCSECPANTFVQETVSCQACPPEQYRLVGQGACLNRVICKDFVEVNIDADSNRCEDPSAKPNEVIFKSAIEDICIGGDVPANRNNSRCIACPTGTLFVSDMKACMPCPSGKYLSQGQCVATEPGYTTARSSKYFFPSDVISAIPAEFESKCSGSCSSKTWSLLGSAATSGVNVGELDTELTLRLSTDPTFQSKPEISFAAMLHNAGVVTRKRMENQVLVHLYINDVMALEDVLKPSELFIRSAEIPSASFLNIRWIFSFEDTSFPAYVTLHNVTVFGTLNGTATEQTECPAGTKESNGVCIDCPAGTYSDSPKATQCKTCPVGSVSDEGSKSCYTCARGTESSNNKCLTKNCTFEGNYVTFSLKEISEMLNTTFSVVSTSGTFQLNPCQQIRPQNCRYESCQEEAYVFGEYANETRMPRTLGNRLEFVQVYEYDPSTLPDYKTVTELHTFDLKFTGGRNLPPACKEVETTVSFYCHPGNSVGLPTLVASEECTTHFKWASYLACKFCTTGNDLEPIKFPCINGIKEEGYLAKSPWCRVNPELILHPATYECDDIEIDFKVGIIGASVSVGLLLVVFGLAIYCYWAKKNLEAKYEVLKNESNWTDNKLGDSGEEENEIALDEMRSREEE